MKGFFMNTENYHKYGLVTEKDENDEVISGSVCPIRLPSNLWTPTSFHTPHTTLVSPIVNFL